MKLRASNLLSWSLRMCFTTAPMVIVSAYPIPGGGGNSTNNTTDCVPATFTSSNNTSVVVCPESQVVRTNRDEWGSPVSSSYGTVPYRQPGIIGIFSQAFSAGLNFLVGIKNALLK